MAVGNAQVRVEELGQHLFQALTQLCLLTPRCRRRLGELKEVEFLTLALLQQTNPRTVGDLQRQLGVLPAQMSRIIRALEDRDRALIACRINTTDKRKIDVDITPAGRKAYSDYQAARLPQLVNIVGKLNDDEQEHLLHLLDRIQGILQPGVIRFEDR
jgi:DNA-binding MarR family transcriptional regulator